MNLADQIEATADRAVADLAAARTAHRRDSRRREVDDEADRGGGTSGAAAD